jgi:hypothetical protein
MHPIQELLANLLANDDLLQSMRERAMGIKKYEDEAQADEEIIRAIDFVMDSYQAVGGLVSEIDRKHTTFTKSSIEKIKYLMTADQTIKGKLTEILKIYARLPESGRDDLAGILEGHIRAGRQEFFDERSLYHKNIRSRRVEREPLAIEQKDDFTGLAEGYLLEQISNGYPTSRVRAFAEGLLADGKDVISSADISINDDSDFILLILVVIRQNERGMPYSVDMRDGRIERNGYFIPDMVIQKKKKKRHVV